MAIRKRQIIRRFAFLLALDFIPIPNIKVVKLLLLKTFFVAAISLHDTGGKNDISLQGKWFKIDIISIKGV